MRRFLSPVVLCIVLATACPPSVLAAQRTFVASNGVDSQPCTIALPCRSFQAAITAVDLGGEVVALDTAGYGPMTINKSVAVIVPPGVHAGITATSGVGVLVSGNGIVVVLRGLYVNGAGASRGIEGLSGAELHVENCVVAGFTSYGIYFVAAGGILMVSDTIVRDNARGGIVTSNFAPQARATVMIDRARIERNGSQIGADTDAGVAALGGADVTISNSYLSANFRGVSACAQINFQPNSVIVVEKSIITFNAVGLFVAPNNGNACIIVSSDNNISRNIVYGIEQQGGNVITSYGGNTVFNVAGNTFGQTFTKN